MRVTLTLEMRDVVMQNGVTIAEMSITWSDDFTEDQILKVSKKWVAEPNFLTKRMEGILSVGETSLVIEPNAT